MNRDPQNTRLAEMQNEIQVINFNLTQYLGFPVVGEVGAFCLARSTGRAVLVRALAGLTVLCSWARHVDISVSLSEV